MMDRIEVENNITQEHTPINELFSYGLASDCVHLHLPTNLHSMIAERGVSGTVDTVNLYLLDAIDKIKELKDNGYDKFQGKDRIYMISPILLGRELRFLEELDFETTTYKKQQLNSEDFLKDNPEAKLATQIFGKGKNVGRAQIKFDLISSNEWQEKKEEKLKEFASKGITFMPRKQELSRKINVEEIEGLEKIEEEQHLEQIDNNLTIKEKFIRFLAKSKHIGKLPFVNKLIYKKIKMLPTDVQEVVNRQTQETNDTNERRKKFNQELRNWTPTTVQEQKDNTSDKVIENQRKREDSDDVQL